MRMLDKNRRFVGAAFLWLACTLCTAQETYFPPKVFGNDQLATMHADLDSFLLRRLEEPSLLVKAQDSSIEAYRFLWLRSFRNPVAVRLEVQSDGTGLLIVKVADGHAGFPRTVTKLLENTTRSISREQTNAFRAKVKSVGFWKAVSRDPGGPAATDGDGWILEGVDAGKYHVVERVLPNRLPHSAHVVRSLGLMLTLELAGMKIPEDEH